MSGAQRKRRAIARRFMSIVLIYAQLVERDCERRWL